jgi:hypothetical protein
MRAGLGDHDDRPFAGPDEAGGEGADDPVAEVSDAPPTTASACSWSALPGIAAASGAIWRRRIAPDPWKPCRHSMRRSRGRRSEEVMADSLPLPLMCVHQQEF